MHQVPIKRSMVFRTVMPRLRKDRKLRAAANRNRVARHRDDLEPAQQRLDLSSCPLIVEALEHLAQHQISNNDLVRA